MSSPHQPVCEQLLLTFKAFPPFQLVTAFVCQRWTTEKQKKWLKHLKIFFLRGETLRERLRYLAIHKKGKKVLRPFFLFSAVRGGLERNRQMNPKKLQKHCEALLLNWQHWLGNIFWISWQHGDVREAPWNDKCCSNRFLPRGGDAEMEKRADGMDVSVLFFFLCCANSFAVYA